MLTLSTAAILEKNKLANTGAWLVLLQITLPDDTVLRVCSNTEDVTWPSSGGDLYVAFPFELDEIGENSKGERPQVEVRVGNVTRQIQLYMEQASGGVGSTVVLRVVHSAHLDLTDAEVELTFTCINAWADSQWAHFVLGASAPWEKRWPRNRILKTFCRYRHFKGDRCGYTGTETTCDRTLTQCREYGNSERFGGCPGAGRRSVYA
jgi:lambda family phage minor tail protein L